MWVRKAAPLALACFLGSWSGGCAARLRPDVLFVSWSAGPNALDDMRVRFGADTSSDLERWNDGDGRWELVCSAPCEQSVSGRGAFRIATATTTSRPFGLPRTARDWMTVRVDRQGNVFTIDSPELRTQRSSAEAAAAAALIVLTMMHTN